MSGIPVIVTKWKHALEFVDDGKTGFIIPFENGFDELTKCILQLYNSKDQLNLMKTNALNKSYEFSANHALKIINNHIF